MSALLAATRAELTKIRTLRSVSLVSGGILALQVLVMVPAMGRYAEAVAGITPDGIIEIFTGQPEPATEAILETLVASSFQMTQFLPAVAAVIAGQEFRSRQLGPTLLAVPRRGRLLAAKALAATGYLLVLTMLIAGISTAFTYAAIKDWNPGLLLTGDAFLGHGKFIAYALLSSLITFAVTVVARSTLIGIVVTVALLTVTLSQVLAGAAPAVDALFPLSAGRNLLLDPQMNRLTAGPAHALVVLIGWALATTSIAGVVLSRRDAR